MRDARRVLVTEKEPKQELNGHSRHDDTPHHFQWLQLLTRLRLEGHQESIKRYIRLTEKQCGLVQQFLERRYHRFGCLNQSINSASIAKEKCILSTIVMGPVSHPD